MIWRPGLNIIEMFESTLRGRPIYRQTEAYGHFGRTDIDLPWEQTDKSGCFPLARCEGIKRRPLLM